MALPNIFSAEITDKQIERINKLTPNTVPQWGKMSVDQVLAHLCVTYEMAYENIHPKPNFLMKLMLKAFVKQAVVGEKGYPKNSRTAPQFIVADKRDFEREKKRLIDYLRKSQNDGRGYFEGKESHSFGVLSAEEWNNMFYKHLDHHLTQFGV